MKRQVEILSPAGSYESLKAAILAGADAVYVGGTQFGARAFADNFDRKKMLEAIDYVHLHGKKIYLTINTLLKEQELKHELYEYLLPYYRQGLDAVIVQDIGVLSFIKEYFPDLAIHASTQMTVTNVLGAKFLEKQGVSRVVTAREMQIDEIREIANQTQLEIESFVHGALCYCYSGQCLYSSMLGGRSGNRGQCAQPCRLPYRVLGEKQPQYLMSLKDICTLEYIPELIECGIHSFKIEGRMKKPEYVALVTAMYRKYVDLYLAYGKEGFWVAEEDKERLMDLYNRGGFHSGYYHTQNGREMISLERPNHAGVPAFRVISSQGKCIIAKSLTELHGGDVIELPDEKENYTLSDTVKKGREFRFYTHRKQNVDAHMILYRIRNERLLNEIEHTILNQKMQEKITGKLFLACDMPAKLSLQYQTHTVEVLGEVVQKAQNQPMSAERIETQIKKTGNTPFVFDALQVTLQGNVFLPVQALNQLRRDGLELLQRAIVEAHRREICKVETTTIDKEHTSLIPDGFHVYVEELEQLEAVLAHDFVKRIYIDDNALVSSMMEDIVSRVHDRGREIYLALPHVFRSNIRRLYEEKYRDIMSPLWDGVLIRNLESYEFLREHDYTGQIVTDYNLYQMNQAAKAFWEKEGVEATTAPLELNERELQEVGLEQSELIVYGYYPMMVSAQCMKKTTESCAGVRGRLQFEDRYHKVFTAKNQCKYCYNVIYNAEPVVLVDQVEQIFNLAPKALRLHFTLEDKEKVNQILEMYATAFYQSDNITEPAKAFTRGHFKRGVK